MTCLQDIDRNTRTKDILHKLAEMFGSLLGHGAVVLLAGCRNSDSICSLTAPAPITAEAGPSCVPVNAGTYRALAIAEESGKDGQIVLCRPAMLGNITV